jgi:hypothetical protein
MISGPADTPKRLDDDIKSGQRALHRGRIKRVTSHFFKFGVVNRNSSG